MMLNWVVAYDIPDSGRRLKLAKILEDFGDRIQYSLFEIKLHEDEIETLRKRVRWTIDSHEDKVRVYTICRGCISKIEDLGFVEVRPFDEPDVIII